MPGLFSYMKIRIFPFVTILSKSTLLYIFILVKFFNLIFYSLFAIILVLAFFLSSISSIFVFIKILLFILYKWFFYTLSNIFVYIYYYSKGIKYIALYFDIIYQILNIFNLNLIFAKNLIKIIKQKKTDFL